MHPDRRRKIDLDQRCETDDDDAEKQDREDCGTVTGILGRQVEPADFACLAHVQKASKEPTPAASRAPATEGHAKRADGANLPCRDRHRRSAGGTGPTAPLSPPIDADKEEKPVPRGCLETEMVIGFEVSPPCAVEADDQKSRADDDVEPMEAGCHEEG